MAKRPRSLTREAIQDYLKEQEGEEAQQESGEESPKDDSSKSSKKSERKAPKKSRPSGARNTIAAVTRTTGRLTHTIGDIVASEVEHSDFKTRMTSFVLGIGIGAVALTLLSILPFIKLAEAKSYDFRMQMRPVAPKQAKSITHLDIDDNSIASVGRWPWPRYQWAGFVRAAKDVGMDSLFFDIEFSEPQQASLNDREMLTLEEWASQGLPDRLSGANDGIRVILLDEKRKLSDAIMELQSENQEVAERGQQNLHGVIRTIMKINEYITQEDLPSIVPEQLRQKLEAISEDQDELFATAMRETQITYLPVSFEQSALVSDTRLLPWNEAGFQVVADFFDTRLAAKDLPNTSRTGLEAYLVGKSFEANDGDTFTFDKAIAARVAAQEFQVLQRLYLYRLIHRWYDDSADEFIRARAAASDEDYADATRDSLLQRHMTEYLANWRHATQVLRARPGEVLAPFAEVLGSGKNQWAKFTLEQLHRFYSYQHLVYEYDVGSKTFNQRTTGPWALPVDCIHGFDEEEYDPWAPKSHDKTFYRNRFAYFRDIDLKPPIFRLFAQSRGTGFVYIEPDPDGKARSVPMVVIYEETYTGKRIVLLQHGLSAVLQRLMVDRSTIRVVPGRYIEFEVDEGYLAKLRGDELGEHEASGETRRVRIEIDDRGHALLNWIGSPSSEIGELFEHTPCGSLIDLDALRVTISAKHDEAKLGFEQRRNAILRGEYTKRMEDQTYAEPALDQVYNFPMANTITGFRELDIRDSQRAEIRQRTLDLALEFWDRVADHVIEWERGQASSESQPTPTQVIRYADGYVKELSDEYVDKIVSVVKEVADIPEVENGEAAELSLLQQALIEEFDLFEDTLRKRATPDLRYAGGRALEGEFRGLVSLSTQDRYELQRLYLRTALELLSPSKEIDGRIERIRTIIEDGVGAKLEDVTIKVRRKDKPLQAFTQLVVGGEALRELLFTARPAYLFSDFERFQTRRDIPDSLWEDLTWEADLMLKAGLIDPKKHIGQANYIDAVENNILEGLTEMAPHIIVRQIRLVRSNYYNAKRTEARYLPELEAKREALGERLEGRTAIVGAAATALGDLLTTPLKAQTPGPLLHSNSYNTVLFHNEPNRAPWLSLLLASVAIVLISFTTARMSAKWGIISFLLVGVVYYVLDGIVFFAVFDRVLAGFSNVTSLGLAFVGIQGYRYAVEYRAKLKIKSQFGKFLSEEAVEELQKNPDALQLGGDESVCTVYFSDIAGFTPISESMSPVRLIHFLNEYMNLTCEAIKDSSGYVDKFIGDAVMAIWNKPVAAPDHAARACKAAVRNAQVLKRWNRDRAEKGELQVGTRIGVGTGPMVVGMMGTDWRLNYTAIGDTVNLSARLEAANKQYGTMIMINDRAWEEANNILVGHVLDNIAVKGKKKGVSVYHLIGLTGETDYKVVEGCKTYTEAFDAYQSGRWAEALQGFKDAKPILPPAYDVKLAPCDHMIERCEHLVDATKQQRMEILGLKSEDDEWDGVWRLTSK